MDWSRRAICCAAAAATFALVPRSQAIADGPERPLVIIPGFAGSQLSQDGKVIWGDGELFGSVDKLAIANGPADPVPKADAAELLRLKVLIFDVQPYDSLVQFLQHDLGYKLGKTLFLFPYDWRQDAFVSAEDLNAFVSQRIPELGPGNQFDVIAHSFGGLVARAYINKFDDVPQRRQIVNLICMGTPFLGSLRAIEALDKPLGSGFVNGFMSGTLGVVSQKTRSTLLTFPSFYEMLPTHERCCIRGDRTKIGTGSNHPFSALDLTEWEGFAGIDKANLARVLRTAAELAALVKTDPPKYVKERLVATGNKETIQGAYFSSPIMAATDVSSSDFDRSNTGDGTVLEWSATRGDPSRNATPSFASHMSIFEDDSVKAVLKATLRPDILAPATPVSSAPRTVRSVEGRVFSNVRSFALSLQGSAVKLGGGLTAVIKIGLSQNDVLGAGDAAHEAAHHLIVLVGIDRFDGQTAAEFTNDWTKRSIRAEFAGEALAGDQILLTYHAKLIVPGEAGVGRLRAASPGGRLDDSILFVVSN